MSLKVSHHSSSLSDKSGKTLELDDNDCLFQVYMTQDLSFEEESPAFSQQLLDPEDGGTPNHEELAEVRPGGRDGKCSRNLDGPIEVFDRPQSPKVDLEPTNSIMNLCGSDDEPEASSPQVQLPELSPDSRNNPLDSLSGSTIVPHLDVPLRLGMEADSDKPATVCSAFDDTADPQPSLTQCDGESAAPATVHKIRSLNPKVWIDVLVGKSHRTGSFRSKNEHHQKVDIDENHEEVVESVRTRRRVRRVTRTSVIGRPQAPVNTHPELHVIPGEDPTLLARNELPVRHIDQFTFRDNEGAPVAVDVIDDPYCDVYVTGWVSPGLQEGGPARHIEAIQMTFECLEWGPWHVESGEPTIWLRSLGNAWYYLQKPAGSYAKMYEAFAFKTQLTALVIKAMTDSPNLEREAFLDYAIAAIQGDRCDDETLSPSRNQIMETLQSNVNALVRDIDNWFQKEIPKDVSEIPFWIELQEMADDIASSSAAKFKRSSDSNEKVLTERTLSIVTPLVAKVFQHFFVNCVDVVKRGVETEIDLEPTAVNVKKMDPVIVQPPRNLVTNVIEWCGDSYSVLNERDAYGNRTGRCLKRYYHSVIIDDITYEAGDTAFIRQEEKYDGGEPEASQAEPWFGQICYLFREKCTDMAHVRWLTHGKQSVLCEAASYNELMMLDECDDIPLATISGKPIVRYLGPDEEEPSDVERDFFYRYLYDSENASFVDAPPPSIDPPARAFADTEIGHCAACQQKLKLSDSDRSFWSADGTKERALQSRAVEYRINDFVYVVNDSPAEPYMIAQILEFSTQKKSRGLFKPNRRRQCERENDTSDFEVDDDIPSDDAGDVVVKLRLFLRSSNILAERDHAAIDEEGDTVYIPPAAFRDVRRVHVTSKTIKVVPDQLEGHCWVQHRATISDLNAFKDELDSFWFDDAVKIGTGNIKQRFEFESIDEKEIVGRADRAGLRTRDVEGRKAFVQDAKPLVALDLFAGAGGLTEGLDSLGFIQTKYAVEFSSSAGTTFKHNFPDATVYVKCANLLLDRAIRVQEGGEILDVIRDESGKILPPLPLKGDVNFIYCGPSCQGFSGLNHNKRVDDVKNTLVATSLSYTDFYRPDYFLLENVKGMADFKLGGVQQGRSIVGGIKMGVVKLILKTLHAMK
ncbi:hypothetical protein HKX48_006953 [Thoreauomyces humboldtii]|nr:hypothetical protein HKX48_006953 [Thoreauomyces humboldtii]